MNIIKREYKYKETHVKILTDNKKYIDIAIEELIKQRNLLEDYIKKDIFFLSALEPVAIKKNAPEIVKLMAEGGKIANVGPMAAVAGTIAEFMVNAMLKKGAAIALVENGGDIFAVAKQSVYIGIYAGYTKLKDKLAFVLNDENTPLSICSSSKLGHSLSFGDCDLATVFSKKGNVADAVATAVGNKVKKDKDIKKTLEWAIKLKGVDGVLVVRNDKFGMIGNIPPLLSSKDKSLKDKVTKEEMYIL